MSIISLPVSYPESNVNIFWLKKEDNSGGSIMTNFNTSLEKTIIFIHGWSSGCIKNGELINNLYSAYPETYKNNQTQVNLYNKWIDAGFNVGIFNWIPFADDDDITDFNAISVVPYNTESKIHSINNIVGMRYRNLDGTTFSKLSPLSILYNKTITEMFIHRYLEFFSSTLYGGYFKTNKEMRIVGFSLGNQIAMCGTSIINQNIYNKTDAYKNIPKITRIELLDPFYCYKNLNLMYSTKCTAFTNTGSSASIILSAFNSLPSKIPTIWYQSTPLTNMAIFGDSNDELKKNIVWQGIKLWCVNDLSLSKRHSLVVDWYFNSLNIKFCSYKYTGNWYSGYKWTKLPEDCNAFSASSSNDYIIRMMPLQKYWIQISNSIFKNNISNIDGSESIETFDDCFSIEDGDYASSIDLLEYL